MVICFTSSESGHSGGGAVQNCSDSEAVLRRELNQPTAGQVNVAKINIYRGTICANAEFQARLGDGEMQLRENSVSVFVFFSVWGKSLWWRDRQLRNHLAESRLIG